MRRILPTVLALAAFAACKKQDQGSGMMSSDATGPIVIGEVGSMTGTERRLVAHIEVAQRAERRQIADIDKGIVWHRRPLFLG